MFFFDSTIIILIPAIALTLYAQYKIKTTYLKYSKILAKNGLSGKEIAEKLLLRNNLSNIKIEPIEGRLSDHYDPRQKKLGLSEEIYYGRSLAAQASGCQKLFSPLSSQQSGTGHQYRLPHGDPPVFNRLYLQFSRPDGYRHYRFFLGCPVSVGHFTGRI